MHSDEGEDEWIKMTCRSGKNGQRREFIPPRRRRPSRTITRSGRQFCSSSPEAELHSSPEHSRRSPRTPAAGTGRHRGPQLQRKVPSHRPSLHSRNQTSRGTRHGPEDHYAGRRSGQQSTCNPPLRHVKSRHNASEERTQQRSNWIDTDDEDFIYKVRIIYKIIRSHHHLHNITRPEPPSSIRKTAMNLASFIMPAAPSKRTQKLLIENARNWEQTTLDILKQHYELNLAEDLMDLTGFSEGDWKGPFHIATGWAKRNFGPRISEIALNNAKTFLSTNLEAPIQALNLLTQAIQPLPSSLSSVSHPAETEASTARAPIRPAPATSILPEGDSSPSVSSDPVVMDRDTHLDSREDPHPAVPSAGLPPASSPARPRSPSGEAQTASLSDPASSCCRPLMAGTEPTRPTCLSAPEPSLPQVTTSSRKKLSRRLRPPGRRSVRH